MMKRLLALLFSLILMTGLTACGGGSDNTTPVNPDVPAVEQPGPFGPGEFGTISLTADWQVPEGALFLDIRNDWERINIRAEGSVGGAVYEYRAPNGNGSERHLMSDFNANVLTLAGSPNRQIILICHSGSRTQAAARQLSNNGFTNVYMIEGGMNTWSAIKPAETIYNRPL
jgi:rhodanese-related sulfurtransferase